MQRKYIISVILNLMFIVGFGQTLTIEQPLDKNGNQLLRMCATDHVVLRVRNPNQYTNFVWKRFLYDPANPIFVTIPGQVSDTLVLEVTNSQLYFYKVEAELDGVHLSSAPIQMDTKPSSSDFQLFVNNKIVSDRETICQSTSLRIGYKPPPGEYIEDNEYQWNTGETDSTIIISETGTYRLNVISEPGRCPKSKTVNVKILNPIITVNELNKSLCQGEEITLQPNKLPVDSITPLIFKWDNNPDLNAAQLVVSTGGHYKLLTSYTTTQNDICKDSVEFIVTENIKPIIKEIDTLTTSEYPFEINISDYISDENNFNFIWKNQLETIISEQTNASLQEEGRYNVKATNNISGCFSMSSFQLNFLPITPPVTPPEEIKEQVYVPTVFSPSQQDENNSSLRVYGEYITDEHFSFEIYNRWGEIVFSTHDLELAKSTGWTGNKNNTGDLLSTGSYTYKVRGQYTNGNTFDKIGNVTLLK
jgi:hypothetical protein